MYDLLHFYGGGIALFNTVFYLLCAFYLCLFYQCSCTLQEKDEENASKPGHSNDKRQTQNEFTQQNYVYAISGKQEQVAPVEEQQDDDGQQISRSLGQEYRPGQVFSVNARELLDLQPERKATGTNNQQLQQLYSTQQQQSQNLQQLYYIEPQNAPQTSLQPSHTVIARPHYSSSVGEASVGAALSVSDTGVNPAASYASDILALLDQAPVAHAKQGFQPYQAPKQYQAQPAPTLQVQSALPQYQQAQTQSVAPQYQQVDRYITKPSKKPTNVRPKVRSHSAAPQPQAAPQQYLIETTNVQQQQPQQSAAQYRPAPRAPQALRFSPFPIPQAYYQQELYERPESQVMQRVSAPRLQQPYNPFSFRNVPQYQQAEATLKQYRNPGTSKVQPVRPEPRYPAASIERPYTILNRYPEPEKMRSVKIYEPAPQEAAPQDALPSQQHGQIINEQYYFRPIYRPIDQRTRYELAPISTRPLDLSRSPEAAKPPHSAIYVRKNLSPIKINRPQPIRLAPAIKIDQPIREQSVIIEQSQSSEQENAEQHDRRLEEQRSLLPPPKNNRAYTPEEFTALVAAGYSVTPIAVAPIGHQVAEATSTPESASHQLQSQRRPTVNKRKQYLPLKGSDAP